MNRFLPFVAFILAMFVIGFSAAAISIPGEWYAGLAKPFFNPPNWIFGPVWTVLYVLIGMAGGIAWLSPARGPLTGLWRAQAALNGAWSIAFFRMQSPAFGLVVVIAMLAAILAFIALAWRPARASALLFIPYALWVSFATLLNATILAMN
jgi:tryptophan-rich sensory protein